MRTLFDLDGPFLSGLNKIADIIILNILYLICCIPVFTIGAATTALYYVTLKMVKNEDCYTVKSFFKSFKDNFKQATGIWLVFLAVIILMAVDFRITAGNADFASMMPSNMSSVVIIVLLFTVFLLTLVLSYVFPVLARFENTAVNTVKNAFLMGLSHLPWTIAIIAINIAPWLIVYFIPGGVIVLTISSALSAFCCSFIFVRIFTKYMPKEEAVSDEQFSISPDQDSFLFANSRNDTVSEEKTNE